MVYGRLSFGGGGFTITIVDGRIKDALKAGGRGAAIAAAQAMNEQAQIIMRESKRKVPLLTGVLQNSGTVTPARASGTRIIAAKLSYGGAASAYAFYQHREHNPPFHYTTPGTGPNYLAGPLNDRIPTIQTAVAQAIARMWPA